MWLQLAHDLKYILLNKDADGLKINSVEPAIFSKQFDEGAKIATRHYMVHESQLLNVLVQETCG